MSDTTASRGITGLAPRKVDPKRMLAANRDIEPSTASQEDATVTATPQETAQEASAAPQTPAKGRKPTKEVARAAQGAQGRVNTYIDGETRARVVAAFKATSHLEGDESFSAFVETALLNEAVRREQLYNGGEEFSAAGKLQRGRPVRG